MNLKDALELCDISKKVDVVLTNTLLENLPRAKYASCLSGRIDPIPNCFPDTRTAILRDINEWIADLSPTTARIFFLNGLAGIGKTTIARTVVETAAQSGILGANFFFSRRGEAELHNPNLVFPTIAYQLARFDLTINRCITEALQKSPDVGFAALQLQAEGLLVQPFFGITHDTKRVALVVLDALDECEARGAKEILQLLPNVVGRLPFLFKILITSRPEHHIMSILNPAPPGSPFPQLRIYTLHDIDTSAVQADIHLFLKAKLAEVPEALQLPLPTDWVTPEEVQALTERSGSLFIYAATAVRFIMDEVALEPRKHLEMLLNVAVLDGHPFSQLDSLYLQLLRNAFGPDSPSAVLERVRTVIGTIVGVREPLPRAALGQLIGLSEVQVASTLRHLQSIIISTENTSPRTFHHSFSDFIRDDQRCTDKSFLILPQEYKERLARRCLELLANGLHKGMLGIDLVGSMNNAEVEDLEKRVAGSIPTELRYACRFWVSHLTRCVEGDELLGGPLRAFATTSLMPWLEAMSWLGFSQAAAASLKEAKSWAVSYSIPTLSPRPSIQSKFVDPAIAVGRGDHPTLGRQLLPRPRASDDDRNGCHAAISLSPSIHSTKYTTPICVCTTGR